MQTSLNYQTGFGNHFESEALEDALIKGCNTPQKVPYGLYTEQLSGSAFTSPRHHNLRSWLYRIRPSVLHSEYTKVEQCNVNGAHFNLGDTPPTQMRWDPLPYQSEPTNFVESLFTLAGNGSTAMQTGAAIHLYAMNASMHNVYFYDADGELLIVPQEGRLLFKTELGHLTVAPQEIIVIPRGVKFQVELLDKTARGYICENFGTPFRLPDLGPIGANGLANPRDFLVPNANFEEKTGDFLLYAKFQGNLWQCELKHSPLDVVAWHGNYVPYKYDLNRFATVNSVSFDHSDPSIFTVLTAPSHLPGIANVDFVIFPPRWMVTEKTFRPPYYHRNIMSEYMGLITGKYDAKEAGFVPGGGSLHNCMSAHGPDTDSYMKAISSPLVPEYYSGTLAFMFESRQVWQVTPQALNAKFRQRDYLNCWMQLKATFNKKVKI